MRELSEQEKLQIVGLAEGLSKEEVCDFLEIDYNELSPESQKRFERAYKKGNVIFKIHAIQKLKESMQGRNGFQASLAALSQFAEEWKKTPDEEGSIREAKSLRIVIDD